MQLDLITETNSDLTVVNAARCSFDKESQWERVHNFSKCNYNVDADICLPCEDWHWQQQLSAADIKLINYLATHHHWTPFAHCQEVFALHMTDFELLDFFVKANLSGFEWCNFESEGAVHDGGINIRGSLYAWLTNSRYLPDDIAYNILVALFDRYPISVRALFEPHDDIQAINKLVKYEPSRVKLMSKGDFDGFGLLTTYDELISYTLRLHIPIFVKRQLETHRRNFVMTDIEDFAQNEVSRRYVQSDPEIYTPAEWRVQAQDKKQGSSGDVLTGYELLVATANYSHHTYTSIVWYNHFNKLQIAHEQSRMILPLSTYTTVWWTGSLKSWKRMLQLRTDSHAQSETQEVAVMIAQVLTDVGAAL